MAENQNHIWPVWATERVEIKPPDPDWSEKGIRQIQKLQTLLASFEVSEIEHIGSTSVPNLPAKPIIDLMAKVKSYDKLDEIVESLKTENWNYVPPELDRKEWRRFFVKVKDDKRECHLHLMLEGEARWGQQLKFRDKLRKMPRLVKQYAELKRRLAEVYQDDREAYTVAKADFIKNLLEHE